MKSISSLLSLAVFAALNVSANFAFAADSDFPHEAAGMRWSAYRGEFTNGCVNHNDRDDGNQCNREGKDDLGNPLVQVYNKGRKLGSNAAQECASIGGHLPTYSEFQKLIKSFDHTERHDRPYLTDAGRAALAKAFGVSVGDLKKEYLWSSSVHQHWASGTYIFDGSVGRIITYGQGWNYKQPIRCVADRAVSK